MHCCIECDLKIVDSPLPQSEKDHEVFELLVSYESSLLSDGSVVYEDGVRPNGGHQYLDKVVEVYASSHPVWPTHILGFLRFDVLKLFSDRSAHIEFSVPSLKPHGCVNYVRLNA